MKIIDLKNLIDDEVKKYFLDKEKTYNNVLFESMAYSINIGGKRIRPILMLLAYNIYKSNYQDILPVSIALEMIHTYSLIHDDLPCMDNDDLRRGMPTNHKVYGEAIAVLAGDALLNEAMNILLNFSLDKGNNALRASKVISEAASANGMIGGQIVDIINEGKDNISLEELNYMHTKKTGELIKAAVVAGGILGEAPENHIKCLEEYGYKLGLAFQIKDDILDVVGSVEKLGKNTKMDEDRNKTNFITIYGVKECENMCRTLTEECIEILSSLSKDCEELIELTNLLLQREN